MKINLMTNNQLKYKEIKNKDETLIRFSNRNCHLPNHEL